MPENSNYKYVNYLWDTNIAGKMDPVERLVYRSRLLGSDQRITNTGGGNTSSKVVESDPITGKDVEVLWVKGSGGDLRTSTKDNFASLELEKLLALIDAYHANPETGVKTEAEDNMVAMYPHAAFNLNPRASSIDTPLHAFIPHKYVNHLHPNAMIAIAAAKESESLTRIIFGDAIGWVPWQRPGFDLGLIIQNLCRTHPDMQGVLLAGHGVISWADEDEASYRLCIDLIEKSAIYIEGQVEAKTLFGGPKYPSLTETEREGILMQLLPWLRGKVSQIHPFIGTTFANKLLLDFVNSKDAARLADLGTSCPDHFLRTKIKPLYVDWDPQNEDLPALRQKLERGIEAYREDYRAYYETCKRPDSPTMRDPNPTVILIPGIGMIAWGKNKSESRVTAEFYNCAVEVIRGAEAIGEYVALPAQESFDIEYWALEEAKLQRMPPEKEMARRVVVVVGAGSGIGRATAHRVATEGAHVVCADVDLDAALKSAEELTEIYGLGVGIGGTGISSCGPAIALQVDVTSRESVKRMFGEVVLAYGGIDDVIVTVGMFPSPDQHGQISDELWDKTFRVNVSGSYFVADEGKKIWNAQQLRGSLVITTSVNGLVPKNGSMAYDTSKAAANHLVRELAIDLAPLVRVNGLAPATVVEGSNMFPRDRVLSSLKKYAIPFNQDDPTDVLRNKLADFYAMRTLLKEPIRLKDQAEVAYLLISQRTSKTTGQIFNVDGGLTEAFMR